MAQGEASVLQAKVEVKNEISPELKEIAKELKAVADSFNSFNDRLLSQFRNVGNSLDENLNNPIKRTRKNIKETVDDSISELDRLNAKLRAREELTKGDELQNIRMRMKEINYEIEKISSADIKITTQAPSYEKFVREIEEAKIGIKSLVDEINKIKSAKPDANVDYLIKNIREYEEIIKELEKKKIEFKIETNPEKLRELREEYDALNKRVYEMAGLEPPKIVNVNELREAVEINDELAASAEKRKLTEEETAEKARKQKEEWGTVNEMQKESVKARENSLSVEEQLSKLSDEQKQKMKEALELAVRKEENQARYNELKDSEINKLQQIAQLESKQRIFTAAETPQTAIDFARQADTTNKMAEAMKALKISMGDIPVNTPKYRELNIEYERLSKNMMAATTAGVQQSHMANQLARSFENLIYRVAFYGSLGMLTRFIKGIAETRGEYEKLEKSFGGIIGNLQEAQTVLERQKELAVFSPFAVKQLQEANKQLAAFGYNAKEIIPLTMQIGDIAAGIGMEMSKLISILGRVKGTGVLDTRTLKSLASEGLNVADMLAKMYSEIENRDVKIREVYQRAANSMITYADLIKVINKYTEEGGMFFEAQAKQADTLKGALKSLGDATRNMMQEIGKDNEGVIKGIVNFIKTLVDNFNIILKVIKPLVVAFGVYKGTLLAIKAINMAEGFVQTIRMIVWETKAVGSLTVALKNLGLARAAALATDPYLLAAAAIMAIGVAIVNSGEKLKTFSERLTEIQKKLEDFAVSDDNINKVDTLIDKYSKLKEEIEQLEISKKYVESLNDAQDDGNNLEEITGNITNKQEELNKTAKELANITSETILKYNEQGDVIDVNIEKAKEWNQTILKGIENSLEVDKKYLEERIQEAERWAGVWANIINTGVIPKNIGLSMEEISQKFQNSLTTIRDSNTELEKIYKTLKKIKGEDVTDTFNDLQKSINKVLKEKGVTFATMFPGKTMDDLQTVLDYTSALTGRQDEYNKKREQLNETIKNGSDEAKAAAKTELENLDKAESAYKEIAKILAIVADLKSGKNQVLEDFKNIVSTIKEAQKDYKEFLNISSNVEKSVSAVSEKFADIWKKLKLPEMDLAKVMKMGNIELAAYLQTFLNDKRIKNNKEAQEYLKKFIGDLTFNAKIDFEKRAIDAFKEELDRIMRGYQVHLEFEKIDDYEIRDLMRKLSEDLGIRIPAEINVEQAIAQLENFQKNLGKETTFEQFAAPMLEIGIDKKLLEEQFDWMIKMQGKSGEEILKLFEEAENKKQEILKNERDRIIKNYQEIYKNYANLQEKITDIQKQAVIDREKIEEQVKLGTISEDEGEKLKFGVEMKEQADISKETFEDMKKNSKEWIIAMGDMDTYSTGAISHIVSVLKEQFAQMTPEMGYTQEEINAFGATIKKLEDTISQRSPFLQIAHEIKKIGEASDNLAKLRMIGEIVGNIGTEVNKLSGIVSEIGGLAEMLGADEYTVDMINSVGESIGAVGEIAQGVGQLMAGDFLGGIKTVISGITKFIGSIFNSLSARIEANVREIDKQYSDVEKNIKTIESRIKNYYRNASGELKKRYQIELELLDQKDKQLELLQQKQEEYAKKPKKYKEELEQTQEEIDKLLEETKYGLDEIAESLMGADLESLLSGFADAIIDNLSDPMKTAEEQAKSLKEEFAKTIKNIIKNALMMDVINEKLQPFIKRFKNMLAGGGTITESSILALLNEGDRIVDGLMGYSEMLKPLFDRINEWIGQTSDVGDFDTLSKGIQGVTEQTAGVLESYLNQMRVAVDSLLANNNYYIVRFDTLVDTNSDILVQMRESVQIQRSIENILLSVVGVGGVTAGQAMKVTVVNF